MISNSIKNVFKNCKKEGRPALLTYIVAGDNSINKSLDILKTISKHADILELGFPHNTPIGDGGQIQTSSYRSIKNGFKIKHIFSIVKKYKKIKNPKPIILMGYYNMIYQFGRRQFLKSCKKAGVNGLIVVDLPWPENLQFARECKKNKIVFVQLIAPTTSRVRMKKIMKNSHEMCYYISMLGTTGSKLKNTPNKILSSYIKVKNLNKSKNVVIGFGITKKTISKFKKADGLVIGSQLCKKITQSLLNRQNIVTNLDKMVYSLKRRIS
tara:strand:- start:1436 stop:2239 length:804 start_codon:yes stop_codon:yes gene_type:complete